ncbi:MAG: LysE family translocator [Alteromonadaceae bacterium]|nr:LysE family translocator [Alteromonadaceae bacterium]
MPSIETLITFSLAAFLLCVSPGPSNLYIMARSLRQGFKAGFAAASGMAIGSFIYVVLSALGLAAVFKYSPTAFLVLKVMGALYLIYLGITYLRSKEQSPQSGTAVNVEIANSKIFYQSIVVELTNPKTALFFMAFLPQFVDVSAGSVTSQFLILGAIYMLMGFLCDLFFAALSSKMGSWLSNNTALLHKQDKISGCIMLGLGAYLGAQELVK